MAEESFRHTFRNAIRVRVPRDGLCGLHAVRASIQAQAPLLPVPSIKELLAVLDQDSEANSRIATALRGADGTTYSNRDWFLQDHLAAIFYLWGQVAGFDVALAIWTQGQGYQIHDSDTTDLNTTIIWVWHNGANHYEGLRDDDASLNDQTSRDSETRPETKTPDNQPLFNDNLLRQLEPRLQTSAGTPKSDDPGVFLSTQREYLAKFRHLNCSFPSSIHRATGCSLFTSVEINEDSSDLKSRWMEACLGNCNEFEYQNDQLEANIAASLQGRAQAFYESAHLKKANVEIVGTRIVWLKNSVPTYFSTRHKTQQPHSAAITPQHLALVQSRGNIDKIQLDFVSYNHKVNQTAEKSGQAKGKIFNILRKFSHGSKVSKTRTSGLRRNMSGVRGARTFALAIALATFLGFLGTKRVENTGLGSLPPYNNIIIR